MLLLVSARVSQVNLTAAAKTKTDTMSIMEGNFSRIREKTELLRAPARKRKPIVPQAEREKGKHVVRMTWDMDTESTNALMEDMGVSLLEDNEDELLEYEPKPTPARPSISDLVPPGAPKVTVVPIPQTNNLTFGDHFQSSFTYIEPQGTNDSNFLFKRHRAEVIEGKDHWEKLSDEMILSIFKWLPKYVLAKCARVCKRWNLLAFDETLWRRVDLANKTIKPGVVGRILDRGVAVLRLTKTEIQAPLYTELDSSINSSFGQARLHKVQYLDLSMAVIDTPGLDDLLSACHHLRKLSLENCEINDSICRHMGQNRNLEVMNLCMCQGITENGLVPICNNLQRLDALNMGWTNMRRGAVVYLVICLPTSLTKLNLSGCRDTLFDEDVQQLCRSCPNLKELDLSDATMITSHSVEFIAQLLTALEYIALSRCYHLMPSSLPLLGHIQTLLAIDVFGMLKESALLQLREALPNIEVNKFPFSSIARPTTGIRRTSIWGLRVRDCAV